MTNDYETPRMLVLSTAHLTNDDRKWLNEQTVHNNPRLVVYPKSEYGWFIPIIEDSDFLKEDVPENIVKLLQFTRVTRCTWLMLDRDADIINELPIYRD
ncbi:hypothetical protein JUJ52_03015 [Virgibacillus sp. AGTR]|uniref:DUF5983 family protein n=1 Tax=Virgibacillus sp. AGTR TaxID=2812055 RepID=UPI001D16549C|nr:hypothetical protein [Virgibacillus sp. AGTR]MCC2248928.1 hypothetical protein [Virgibacillus sp. AGTR]